MLRVNSDGLFLSTEEFASLMFQLRAIEQSFYEKSKKLVTETEQEDGTAAVICSRKREHVKEKTATTVKPKKTKKQDELLLWYGKLVKAKIEELVKEDCFGCLMNLMDQHKCDTPSNEYVDDYFDKAMALIDDSNDLKELTMKNCPSKLELLTNIKWCNELKQMVKIL